MENRESFFYSRVLFWGFGLSLIINICGTSFWVAELLGALISFLILLFVKKVNDNKILKTVSGFTFALFATIILANMGNTMYLKETPAYILTTLPLIVGFIVGKSSKNAFKRTIFILFVYSMFMFFFAAGSLASYARPANILPFEFDVKRIILGTVIYVLSSVTPVLCLNDFKEKKTLMVNYAASCLTVLVTSFLVVSVLGSKEAMLYRYPEFVLLKRIKIYEFFSNVENLFVIMIVVDFITTIASGFKNCECKGKYTKLIILAILCFVTTFFCKHGAIMTFIYSNFPYVLAVFFGLTLFPKK